MFIRLLIIFLFCSSCSTMKKTMLTTSLGGAIVGGTGGAIFSPNKQSIDKNAFIFSLVGAGLGALGGYLSHERPKDQKELKNMLMEEEKIEQQLPLFDFSPELQKLRPNVTFKPVKKYEVPLEKLPPELQGKVKKQFVLEYVSEGKTITFGNRTIQISPFKAWENVYEE